MSHVYQEMIMADTGCAPADTTIVEEIMRNEIFHSTLDWQSRAQLRGAAREAHQILQENRALYEAHQAQARHIFEEGQRKEAEAKR